MLIISTLFDLSLEMDGKGERKLYIPCRYKFILIFFLTTVRLDLSCPVFFTLIFLVINFSIVQVSYGMHVEQVQKQNILKLRILN